MDNRIVKQDNIDMLYENSAFLSLIRVYLVSSAAQEGWDREGGRETQEGGDMGIYVYV